MLNKRSIIENFRFLFLLTFLGFSCSDGWMGPGTANSNENFDIRSDHGFLEFRSDELFQQTLAQLEEKTPAQVIAWTKQFADYTSLAEMYERSVDAEIAFFEKMNALTEEELDKIDLSNIDRKTMHAEYVLENQEYFNFSEDGNFEIKIAAPYRYHPILNKDGIVKVGDIIYKFYENQEKLILDGDIKKLAIIDQVHEDTEGIKVYDTFSKNVSTLKRDHKNAVELWDPNWTFHCCNRNGDFRVWAVIKVFYFATAVACPAGGLKYEMAFTCQNQKKGLFGWSRNRTKQLAIQINSLNIAANIPGSNIIAIPSLYKPGNMTNEISRTVWETACGNYIPTSLDLETLSIDGDVSYHGQNYTACYNASTNC